MNMHSLQGLRVLITRPKERAQRFAEALANAGGEPVIFPAVDIQARERASVRSDLAGLAITEEPLFIFVSGPAVTHGLQTVTEIFGEPGILRTAAVGPHSKALLQAAGCKDVLSPSAGGNGSDALLEVLERIDLGDRPAVILRGESGRENLAEVLRARGASVYMVSVYERAKPAADASAIEKRLIDGRIDVVTVTSAGIYENLLSMLGEEARQCLRRTPLLVPSQRVVTIVREHGAEGGVIRAAGADDAALLAALEQWRAAKPAVDGSGEISMNEDKRPENKASEATTGGDSPGVKPDKPAGQTPLSAEPKSPGKAEAASVAKAAASKKPFEKGTAEKGKSAKPQAEAKPKSGRGIAALALLVALAALAGSAWQWWQDQQSDKNSASIARDLDQNATRLGAGLRADLDALKNDVASLDDQFANVLIDQKSIELELDGIDNLNARTQELASELEGMRGVSNSAKRSWAIAEAAYFLQAANTSLQLGRNVDAASNALAAADDRIASLGEPALLPVRQAIASELQSLRTLPDTDVTGIALTLGKLASDAGNLTTRTDKPEAYATAGQEAEAEVPEQGLGRAKRVLGDAMKSMITVRRTDQQATALLAPEEEFFLARNLELQLLTARLALLREEPELFTQSVETSLGWLKEFFDTSNPAVAATISTLEDMRSTAVRRTMPDISASLTLLRGMQDERQ